MKNSRTMGMGTPLTNVTCFRMDVEIELGRSVTLEKKDRHGVYCIYKCLEEDILSNPGRC